MDGRPDLTRLSIARYEPGPVGALVGCATRLFWLAGLLGVLLVAYAEADRRELVFWKEKPAEKAAPVAPVRSASAAVTPERPRAPRPLLAPVIGYVLAARKASIGFARPGKIRDLLVALGETVPADHLIARLEDELPRAEVAKARATLEDAERELARREKLVQEGVGPAIDRDQMLSRVKVARADLDLAERSLAQCELRAPFSGTVTARQAEVGETASGFVVTITDLSAPEVEADVPESMVEKLESDQPAEIELDALSGVKLRGRLRLILPTADRRKATVPVRVALRDAPAKLRPDMSARVTFLATSAPDEVPAAVPDPSLALGAPEKPHRRLDDATRVAGEVATKADRLPWFRQATLGVLGAAVGFMVLGRALRARGGRRPSPPLPTLAPLAPAPPPPPARTPGPKRASFRLQKQDSISDIESMEEMYVLAEDDEATGSGSDVAAPPAASRRVYPLGRDGRIAGDGKPVTGGALDLGGVKVSFAVDDSGGADAGSGAHLFASRDVPVRIEDVLVSREGAPLVHGMVFTVGERPWLYLDRAPNQAEKRRIFVVTVEGSTSVEEKVFPGAPPPLEGEAIVSVRGLEKVYWRGKNEVRVLAGLDLDVAAGDFLALMGPSGSGKSTLLNVIAGIDRPTRGTVHVAGTEIGSLGESSLADWRARNVGFIFQFYNLIPVLSAVENVEIALNLLDLSRGEKRRRALHALELVGLADRAEHKPRELSGGQEQRVAIARAIATDPRLLVADEPTGDLDAENAQAILELLGRLNGELGKTIVMVTHDPRAAARARHVRHLEKGVLA